MKATRGDLKQYILHCVELITHTRQCKGKKNSTIINKQEKTPEKLNTLFTKRKRV